MEDCKDVVSLFEALLEDLFSIILTWLEVILFSTIKQISNSFLFTKSEQGPFLFIFFFL